MGGFTGATGKTDASLEVASKLKTHWEKLGLKVSEPAIDETHVNMFVQNQNAKAETAAFTIIRLQERYYWHGHLDPDFADPNGTEIWLHAHDLKHKFSELSINTLKTCDLGINAHNAVCFRTVENEAESIQREGNIIAKDLGFNIDG